jgi:predicted anti-sigma-YlaC factor YlaD
MSIVKYFFVGLFFALLVSCSIDRIAINKVADMLSGETSTVFTGEEDPELLNQALPFALKLYETLIESVPDNPRLYLSAGKAFCLYAFSAAQIPAELLPDTEYELKQAQLTRAKKLFLRARNLLFKAMDLRHPGFSVLLMEQKKDSQAMNLLDRDDLPFVYWLASAWMGAFSLDSFDMELMISHPKAIALLNRSLEWDQNYEQGGAHDILISYYGSLPKEMGGNEETARSHFQSAVKIAGKRRNGPYLALAMSVCVNRQYREEFRLLCEETLNLDVNAYPENRLLNILNKKKAAWLLERIDQLFLPAVKDDAPTGDDNTGVKAKP